VQNKVKNINNKIMMKKHSGGLSKKQMRSSELVAQSIDTKN